MIGLIAGRDLLIWIWPNVATDRCVFDAGIVAPAGRTSDFEPATSVLPAVFSSSLNSSFAFWNSLIAWPIPRASSGNFFAPNKTRTMSRMTIRSGPAKFMKLARNIISQSKHSSASAGLQGNSRRAARLLS